MQGAFRKNIQIAVATGAPDDEQAGQKRRRAAPNRSRVWPTSLLHAAFYDADSALSSPEFFRLSCFNPVIDRGNNTRAIMIIHIDYHAAYEYDDQVSLSPHIVRVFPRRDMYTRGIELAFHCGGGADVQFRRDLHDNETAYCFFPAATHAFELSLRATLELTPRNPLHFLLDSHGLNIPPAYSEPESARLRPYLERIESVDLPGPLAPAGERPTVETLMTMVRWIHGHIAYEQRLEGEPYAPAELLARGRGACRDFASLLIEALRRNGVAARWVSGYLWEESSADRVAENALHAWVEAYLPGAGWIALDPTNGVFPDHHAIPTAAGLTPEDIAPVSGTYYGHRQIPSRLTTRLTIDEVR